MKDRKKRKPKRRKPRDPAWRPTRQRRGLSDALPMRADNQPIDKMSVLFDASSTSPSLQSPLAKTLAEITPNRPIARIVKTSIDGSPLIVETPEGTQLPRIATYDSISFFGDTGKSPYKPPKSSSIDDSFYDSDAYKQIKIILDTIKVQELDITTAGLAKVKKKYQQQGGQRGISQQKAMTAEGKSEKYSSTKDYVKATTLYTGAAKWEWLHLIGYMIGGEDTQHDENLVAGTEFANTDMMFIEREISFLAKNYPEGFQLKVKAHMIKGTHIATKINYMITTPDFTMNFSFHPQSDRKPHIRFKDYIHRYVETLIKESQKKEDEPRRSKRLKDKSKKTSKVKQGLFFNKEELKEKAEREKREQKKIKK